MWLLFLKGRPPGWRMANRHLHGSEAHHPLSEHAQAPSSVLLIRELKGIGWLLKENKYEFPRTYPVPGYQ